MAVPSLTGTAFLLSPLVFAAIAGLLLRRNPLRLTELKFRWIGLLWAAAALAFVRYTDPDWLPHWSRAYDGLAVLGAAWTLGACWVVLNLSGRDAGMRTGLVTLWTGFTLNFLTIALNRGVMPYSASAARLAGFTQQGPAVVGHAELNRGHLLPWLADIVPVPVIAKVVSVGDLLMIAGLVVVLVSGMARKQP
ncbi:hypothetical protein Rhe02_78030 [Rhizocola hellebori]|uniref:DUF5317 domain-containing protein n=1 Tax=Rhizocola hellebori TaxID=1392758 RepID=A0A8J3QFF3_9ACTN|nr:DUF5317 family protein [Rhizocola hellebori]GIH09736.1 hypothetical protein Rhe02_78030 [Rhizocola hellebori]